MLDFSDGYSDRIKVFTDISWIKEKYQQGYIEITEDFSNNDFCIFNNDCKEGDELIYTVSADNCGTSPNAYMGGKYVEAYLNMIQKFNPEVCGIGMADINDVKAVTKGNLVEYIKRDTAVDSETEYINGFIKSQKGGKFIGSAILFVSVKDYIKLSSYIKIIEELYPKVDLVSITPAQREVCTENYMELFIFSWEAECISTAKYDFY